MFDFLPKYYTTYIDATVTTLKVSLIAFSENKYNKSFKCISNNLC